MNLAATFRNFWLPLIGGVVLALPVLFLGEQPAGAVLPPAPAPPHSLQLSCGPFVETFATMRAEAQRIAILASSTAAPAEDEFAALEAAAAWREIASAARALDGWMWEARSDSAPLSLHEAAVISVSAPATREMQLESAAVAGELIAMPSELDAALLVSRMQFVERTAAEIARSLEPLATCEATQELSFAPAAGDCETLDPEYQFAVAGPCAY